MKVKELLEPARNKFKAYSEEKQIATIRHVLNIKPGEGYDY